MKFLSTASFLALALPSVATALEEYESGATVGPYSNGATVGPVFNGAATGTTIPATARQATGTDIPYGGVELDTAPAQASPTDNGSSEAVPEDVPQIDAPENSKKPGGKHHKPTEQPSPVQPGGKNCRTTRPFPVQGGGPTEPAAMQDGVRELWERQNPEPKPSTKPQPAAVNPQPSTANLAPRVPPTSNFGDISGIITETLRAALQTGSANGKRVPPTSNFGDISVTITETLREVLQTGSAQAVPPSSDFGDTTIPPQDLAARAIATPVPEVVYTPVPEPVYTPLPEPIYTPLPEPISTPIDAQTTPIDVYARQPSTLQTIIVPTLSVEDVLRERVAIPPTSDFGDISAPITSTIGARNAVTETTSSGEEVAQPTTSKEAPVPTSSAEDVLRERVAIPPTSDFGDISTPITSTIGARNAVPKTTSSGGEVALPTTS